MTDARAAALIGVTAWNPRGESALCVVEKLAMANYLSPGDIAWAFGALGPCSFATASRRDAYDPATIRLERLTSMAGWSPDALDASTPGWYRPPGSDPAVPATVFFDLHARTRLCPSCARFDVHLALHQFGALERCPIHREPLAETCPQCDEPFRRHTYPPLEGHHSVGCLRCPWGGSTPDSAGAARLGRLRIELLEGYAAWMAEIARAGGQGGDGPTLLVEPIRRFATLACVHALVPGPAWARDCLIGGERVRQDESAVRWKAGTPRADSRAASAGGRASAASAGGEPVARGRVRTPEALFYDRAAEWRSRLAHRYNPHDALPGGELTRSGYRMGLNEHVSLGATALMWWNVCLAFEAHTRTDDRPGVFVMSRAAQHSAVDCWAVGASRWLRWERSPALDPDDGAAPSEALTRSADRFVESLFLCLLGQTSLLWDEPLQAADLVEHAYDIGGMPTTLLTRTKKGTRTVVATTLAPEAGFRRLFASGYTGVRRTVEPGPDVEPVRQLAAVVPAVSGRRTARLVRRRLRDGPR